MFLVLLYNLLCKTFKDHSSTFAASLPSERNSLLQERCFPIASAKVGHFRIPCKTSTKKNARKIRLHPFCYFIAWQNRQLSPFFSLHPLPIISTPKPPFFVRSSHFWGKNHLFRGVFLFSSRDFLARNLCLRRKNQFDGEFLFGVRPYFDFCRRGKGESRRFSLPPHSTRKRQADFLSKLLHFSRLHPLFLSKPPHLAQIPIQSYAQDTRLRVYTRSRSQRIFHYYLHPSPHRATNCISVA